MNESASRESHWLNERLQRLGTDDLDFGVVRSPLRPVVERSDPWQADPRRHDFSAVLPRLLPDPAESESGPGSDPTPRKGRVVVVTDVEEDPMGRVQAAVLLARRLVEGDTRVLLADADLRHVGLSRWMPDRDLDAEGLVDILQYGASVAAVLRKGPLEGVSILSVGSYRPDGVDLYDDQGLGRLIAQLRACADVVLIVLPAWLANERFHPVLVHADAVVVSMHLDRSLAPMLEDLLRYLQGLNVDIAGLITFAGPDASEKQVDQLLRETDPWREPEEVEDLEASPADETTATVSAESGVSRGVSGSFQPEFHDVVVPSSEHQPAQMEEPQPRGFRRRSASEAERSSPVLRIAIIAAAVALLAFVGWWGLTQREHPPARPRPVVQRPAPPVEQAQQAPRTPSTDVSEGSSVPPSGGDGDGAARADGGLSATDTVRSAASIAESLAAAGDRSPAAQPRVTPVAAAEAAPSEPAVPEQVSPVAPDDYERALALPVGGGYALHLYSFADSTDALSVLPRLHRQGWQTAVRGADIPGKGHWYRVLVGRFDDRASAMAARDAVGERAGVDWVGVVRVP